MSSGKYENHLHFFYTCRKIIRNKQIDNQPLEEKLFNVTLEIYDFTTTNKTIINRKNLRKPTAIFTYRLVDCNAMPQISDLIDKFPAEVINDYIILFTKSNKDILSDMDSCINYVNVRKEISYKEPSEIVHWNTNTQKYMTLTQSFYNLRDHLEEASRVYFLYDVDKKLIYIGKSYSLWKRIITSAKTHGAIYCSYIVINNKVDTDIYEIYYISKFKPSENVTSKNKDVATITLPKIKQSKLIQIYEFNEAKHQEAMQEHSYKTS